MHRHLTTATGDVGLCGTCNNAYEVLEMSRVLSRRKLETPEFVTYDAGFTDGWNRCLEREFNANGGFNAKRLSDKTFMAMIRKCYREWVRTRPGNNGN